MARRIATRLMVGAAFLVVGAIGLYLVGMNIFLRTRAFRDAIGFDPEALRVEYDSAYSLLPGRIHVDGLRIRGRDGAVEWILALDHCDFRTSFTDLILKQFHASHVVGDGLSLRLRRRRDSITPEEMAATPPIDGFDYPPLTDSGPPPPPLTDATYHLWSVRLEAVDARHVREIWIDTVRYTGDFEVRGDWLFRPLRWLEIAHASVEMHPLTASWGEAEPLISDVSGSLKVTCDATPLQEIRGAEILHRFSVSGAVGGVLHVATAVRRVAPDAGAVGGDAAIDVRVAIDHGVVRAGTDVRLRPFDARVFAMELAFDASLSATARVEKEGLGAATLEIDDLDVSQAGVTRGRVKRIAATFASRDLDLVRPLADATYAVDVTGAETHSLPFWRARFPQSHGVQVGSGVATASAHVQGTAASRSGKGHIDVEVRDLHGSYGGATAVASSVDLRADLDVDRSGLHGTLSVDAPEIEVPSLPRLGRLVPLGPLSIDGGSARGALTAHADLESGVTEGAARLVTRGLQARLGSRVLRGQLQLAVKARRTGDQTDLSGTYLVFTGDPSSAETDWWARAEVSAAVLRVGATARLRARLLGLAKDGSPLTAALSESTGVPQFLMDVVSTKALQVSGELVVAPSVFEARSVRAHGDGVDAALEYAALGADKRWALALDLGLVRVGIHSADDRTEVVLFNVQPWFDARVALLRSAEPAVPP